MHNCLSKVLSDISLLCGTGTSLTRSQRVAPPPDPTRRPPQKSDQKVISLSFLDSGSLTSAGPFSVSGGGSLQDAGMFVAPLSCSLIQTHFLPSSCLHSAPPASLLSRYLVCIQESDSHSERREGGESVNSDDVPALLFSSSQNPP